MAGIPTREPAAVIAGDTVKWRREDLAADYPATAGWALSYALRNGEGKIDVSASADGAHFAVTVAAATTALWKPGTYGWVARVALAGEVFSVGGGTMVVHPNLATSDVRDLRTHAERTLDAIEASIEGRASKDQESYRIGDRELRRIPIEELLVLRDRYRNEVAALRAAEALKSGARSPGALFVRL